MFPLGLHHLPRSDGTKCHELSFLNVQGVYFSLFIYLFFWQIIALQIFVVFSQTSTWISHQSVSQFSCSVMSDSLRPHESQHARPPCPSHLPEFTQTHVHRVGDAIQTFHPPSSPSPPAPIPSQHQSFPMSKLFTWGGQSIGVSTLASFLPKNTQDWSILEWTGWNSSQSKGHSRVFSNTTVQKHQFFGTQPSSQSNSDIHTWPLEKP